MHKNVRFVVMEGDNGDLFWDGTTWTQESRALGMSVEDAHRTADAWGGAVVNPCERCGIRPEVPRGNMCADWCDACLAEHGCREWVVVDDDYALIMAYDSDAPNNPIVYATEDDALEACHARTGHNGNAVPLADWRAHVADLAAQCDTCEGNARIGYGADREDCPACKGTGRKG